MSRHDRWLLIRLAAQNVFRRRLRAMFLGAAVMLGVGIAFASFSRLWMLRHAKDWRRGFERAGKDIDQPIDRVYMKEVMMR
jgi:hypothetical protein